MDESEDLEDEGKSEKDVDVDEAGSGEDDEEDDMDEEEAGGDGYLLDGDGSEGEEDEHADGEEKEAEIGGEEEQRMLHDVMAGLLGQDDEEQPATTTTTNNKKEQPKAGADQQPHMEPLDKKGQAAPAAAAAAPSAKPVEKAPVRADNSAVQRTVFVRGLPLDITRIALQAKMEGYGRVKSCRYGREKDVIDNGNRA